MKSGLYGERKTTLLQEPRRHGLSFLILNLLFFFAVNIVVPHTAIAHNPTTSKVDKAVYSFDIPPQPLENALSQLAAQTRLQVIYDSELVRNIESPGLKGSHSRQKALDLLLTGSGVDYQMTGANSATLKETRYRKYTQLNLEPAEDDEMPDLMAQNNNETTEKEKTGNEKASKKSIEMKPVKVIADRQNILEKSQSAYEKVNGYVAKESGTATKTSTPIKEISRSISVVTSDQVAKQKSFSVNEALRYTAGVIAENRGIDSSKSEVWIRGFRLEDSMYRDGLKGHGQGFFTIAQTTIDPYGMERIEVLKGPASILFGQGQPGGIVNIITKRPTEKPFGEVEFRAASYDRFQGAFDVGGPIDEEKKFLFRLTGLVRDTDTQIDFLDESREYIAPALTWRPTSKTSLTIMSQYQNDELIPVMFVPAHGTILQNPNGDLPTSTYLGDPNFNQFDNEFFSVGYLLEHAFNKNILLRHTGRYVDFSMDEREVFGNVGFQADLRTLNRSSFLADEDGYFMSTDSNIQANFELGPTKHTVLLGLDAKWASLDAIRLGGAAPTLDVFSPVYGQTIPAPTNTFVNQLEDLTQVGFYFQDQIRAWDQLIVTLGGRHDWADKETFSRATMMTTIQSAAAFTGQAGLMYLYDNGLAPYFNFSESFQPQGGRDFSGNQFIPTTGTQFEAGVKYQPEGSNSLITLSIYELTQQNVLTSDPTNVGFSIQTGEVRSRGFELEVKLNPVKNLNILGAYAYTDARVTRSTTNNLDKMLRQVPIHTGSIWADYTWSSGLLSGFGFGTGVRHVGESPGDITNTFEVPSFTLVDAALHYDLEGVLKGARLGLNVSNLLDTDYISSCGSVTACNWGPRRMVTGSVSYRW